MQIFLYLDICEDMQDKKFICWAIWALHTCRPKCTVSVNALLSMQAVTTSRWLMSSCGTPCVFEMGVTNVREEIHPKPLNYVSA